MAPRHYRVVWTEQASRTLDEALEYVAQRSLFAAQQLLTDCLTAAESLEELAERGHPVPETDRYLARELFVQRYRMLYDVRGEAAGFAESSYIGMKPMALVSVISGSNATSIPYEAP